MRWLICVYFFFFFFLFSLFILSLITFDVENRLLYFNHFILYLMNLFHSIVLPNTSHTLLKLFQLLLLQFGF